MKQTFREWLKENENKPKSKISKDIKESLYIFESFDSHYDISKIYIDERGRKCYNFSINNLFYRCYINKFLGDKIEIGFEKRDGFFSNKWSVIGFTNELKNGEVQKLFGTVIYIVSKLYKENFNYIFIYSEEAKKFNIYLRIAKQIHLNLLPDSIIEYENNTIVISKKDAKSLDVQEIESKYLKNKNIKG